MERNEKELSKIMFKLRMKYGHVKMDEQLYGFIKAYAEMQPFFIRAMFKYHHDQALEYVSRRLKECYPHEDYNWDIKK